MNDCKSIKYLIIDVDGTMTDAGIYYDEHGNEMKKFCTKDAAGFFAAHQAGIKVMVLTGRESYAVKRRMEEMQVDFICQNVKNKKSYLSAFMNERGITKEMIGYIGDDLNDYPAMKLAGFIGCPSNACEEILEMADYVSTYKGGEGAVRDVICYILKQSGLWETAIKQVYEIETSEKKECSL